MRLLPYDSWSIESPLHVHTLVIGMTERIEPCKWLRGLFNTHHMALQGTVTENGFSASRIIHYRNSFLPMIYGNFIPNQKGTTIRIRMMLHPFVLAFLGVWFGMLGLFSLAGIASAIENRSWGFLGFIGIMGGFALLLTYGAFFAEAGKTKRLISQVLLEVHKQAANNTSEDIPASRPKSSA